jgi:hypothetical protein
MYAFTKWKNLTSIFPKKNTTIQLRTRFASTVLKTERNFSNCANTMLFRSSLLRLLQSKNWTERRYFSSGEAEKKVEMEGEKQTEKIDTQTNSETEQQKPFFETLQEKKKKRVATGNPFFVTRRETFEESDFHDKNFNHYAYYSSLESTKRVDRIVLIAQLFFLAIFVMAYFRSRGKKVIDWGSIKELGVNLDSDGPSPSGNPATPQINGPLPNAIPFVNDKPLTNNPPSASTSKQPAAASPAPNSSPQKEVTKKQ